MSTLPLGIGLEPEFVGSNERLALLRGQHTLTLLGKELAQIFVLDASHSLVVAIGQGIELLAATLILHHALTRAQGAGSLEVDIMGMEGKGTDNIIRIGVVPAAIGGGIVDGKGLDERHARLDRPVDHAAQIAKVADSIAVLAAQREHGNDHAGSAPRLLAETQMTAVQHQHLPVDTLDGYGAIVALFPCQQFMALGVDHHKLIFYGHHPPLGIDREHPFVHAGIVHLQIAAGAPRANGRMGATDGYTLTGLELGSRHTEDDGPAEQGQAECLDLLVARSMHGGEIGIGIEMERQGTVAPLVGEEIILGGIEMIDAGHHVPLAAEHLLVSILDLIAIDNMRQRMLAAHQGCRLQCPLLAILGLHQQILMAHGAVLTVEMDADMQTFAPCGMIMYSEFQFHVFCNNFCKGTKKFRV